MAGKNTTTAPKGHKDTLLECGGVYEMKHPDPYGATVRGMMISSTNEGKGGGKTKTRVTGLLQLPRFKPEVVEEGGERLNQFKLVGRAAPVKGPGRPPKEI